jgi:hypothetical protein
MIDYNEYKVDFNHFNLLPEQFDQQSYLHGIKHTYRVMLHCLRLGILTNKIREAKIAFFGAYIHDMARLHDGYCTIHGAEAAKYKLPLYEGLFSKYGAIRDDILTIRQIVTRHSLHAEPQKDSKTFSTLAILKDADALDRIRLGVHDLNRDYLRYEITHKCITFGEELFCETNEETITTFNEVIAIANKLDSNSYVY